MATAAELLFPKLVVFGATGPTGLAVVQRWHNAIRGQVHNVATASPAAASVGCGDIAED